MRCSTVVHEEAAVLREHLHLQVAVVLLRGPAAAHRHHIGRGRGAKMRKLTR